MNRGACLAWLGVFALAVAGCGGEEGGDASSEADVKAGATSQLVLHYEPARKAEMIKNKVFKADEFTGNDVVVKDAKTAIDIATLLPESDTTAPDRICYKGQIPAVTKILETMVGNTDGNGDHFLKGKPKVDADGSGKLKLRFTVVGEGGDTPQELDVPKC